MNVEFRGWRFRVDPERTRAAYGSSTTRGAHTCSCAYCRNLVAQRSLEYPEELCSFLKLVGVDPFKEAEVWEAGPLRDGYNYNSGWWHFVGEIESEGETPVRLGTQPGGRSRMWEIVFSAGPGQLKLESLPAAPLVTAEFSTELPWVLDEPYPAG
jgi:hypothetical protein